MAVVPSCNTLYFHTEPKDNVITLVYEEVLSQPLPANSMAIFKVKCSAPHLFRVVPTYGAVLLRDGDGMKPVGYKGGDITFSLIRSQSLLSTANVRFAIEYHILSDEAITYNRIMRSLSRPSEQSETVKSAWSLVASGTLSKTHVSAKHLIPLSIVHETEGGKPLEVPPAARLFGRGSYRPPDVEEGSPGSTGGEVDNGVESGSMQGLKEVVRSMRSDLASSTKKSPTSTGKTSLPSTEPTPAPQPVPAPRVAVPLKSSGSTVMEFHGSEKAQGVWWIPLGVTMAVLFFVPFLLQSLFGLVGHQGFH